MIRHQIMEFIAASGEDGVTLREIVDETGYDQLTIEVALQTMIESEHVVQASSGELIFYAGISYGLSFS